MAVVKNLPHKKLPPYITKKGHALQFPIKKVSPKGVVQLASTESPAWKMEWEEWVDKGRPVASDQYIKSLTDQFKRLLRKKYPGVGEKNIDASAEHFFKNADTLNSILQTLENLNRSMKAKKAK